MRPLRQALAFDLLVAMELTALNFEPLCCKIRDPTVVKKDNTQKEKK